MNYTTYDSTGRITGSYGFSNQEIRDLNLAGKNYIEGSYDGFLYYIQNGAPVAKPKQPSSNHEFDYTTKSWVLNIDKATDSVRNQRNSLLSIVDKINPIWYASLTTEQQQELATFRQTLLDIPQQSGFPVDVIFPTIPQWLT